MLLTRTSLILSALAVVAHAQVGNSSARLAACKSAILPQSFTQYLNASFLGQRKFVEAGSVNFTYFQFGPLISNATGRPLLMISGQSALATTWTPDLLQTLAQGRQVTLFTNRGIGLSQDAETQNYTVADYADSTVDLIEVLNLQQPDVLGWSLGGFITMTLAVNYPDLVNKIVLVDTSSGGLGFSATSRAYGQALQPIFEAGEPVPATTIFPDSPAGNAALCRWEASLATLPEEPVTPQQVARQTTAINGFEDDPDSTVYHALSNITSSTLIVVGTLDQVFSFEDSLLMMDAISGASLLQYADAGHAAMLQHGVTAGQEIAAFLDG